ncbi:MAG: hypothetical protein OEV64_09665 [Desulfobulbaceae bacterium]|nr:hypothetical protein [Desulfobulbaceae bacterium]
MAYLSHVGYECAPINECILETTAGLFDLFTNKYVLKDNIRNSINDLLILSTAIDKKLPLFTKDNLLNRFAAEVHEAPIKMIGGNIQIDFSGHGPIEKKNNYESKGYINRGWSYSIKKGNI